MFNNEPVRSCLMLAPQIHNGEIITIEKEEITKDYTWEMPSNWPQNNFETSWTNVSWDVSNLALVAFVQNKYTKEVLQVTGFK